MNTNPNEHQQGGPSHLETAWSPVADAMRHDLPAPITKQGNPIDPPDPGSPTSRIMAAFLCVLIVVIMVAWTNTSNEFKYKFLPNQSAPTIDESPGRAAPGNFGQIDLPARIAMRGFAGFRSYIDLSMIENTEIAMIDEDRVRLIMLAGEIEGDEAALDRIQQLREDLAAPPSADEQEQAGSAPSDLVIAELNALETIYTYGIDALEDHQRDQLAARYGLVGKVALTHGLDDSDPLRAPLIDLMMPITLFMVLAGLVILLVPMIGLVLLTVGIVFLATGRMKLRNHVPVKGGSIFLETYVLFVGAFLAMSIGAFFVASIGAYTLIIQWVLIVTIFWGVLRGMRLVDWRNAIGWHRGEGVFKEIGCGILAYIASVPLFIAGTLLTFILLTIQGLIQTALNNGVAPEPEPVTNPIFEMIASGDVLTIGLLFLLATTWAPIVEEAIFRGALFRHLRGSLHWVFAAFLSAFLFAFMHSYGPLMVSPLIALGFMFAFMREWRGSLIAPMTAHFLHNFTIMGATIVFVLLIKGPA